MILFLVLFFQHKIVPINAAVSQHDSLCSFALPLHWLAVGTSKTSRIAYRPAQHIAHSSLEQPSQQPPGRRCCGVELPRSTYLSFCPSSSSYDWPLLVVTPSLLGKPCGPWLGRTLFILSRMIYRPRYASRALLKCLFHLLCLHGGKLPTSR